jgi:hypothetical protein
MILPRHSTSPANWTNLQACISPLSRLPATQSCSRTVTNNYSVSFHAPLMFFTTRLRHPDETDLYISSGSTRVRGARVTCGEWFNVDGGFESAYLTFGSDGGRAITLMERAYKLKVSSGFEYWQGKWGLPPRTTTRTSTWEEEG